MVFRSSLPSTGILTSTFQICTLLRQRLMSVAQRLEAAGSIILIFGEMILMKAVKTSLCLLLLLLFTGGSFAQSKLPLSNRQRKAFRAAYPKITDQVETGIYSVVCLENPFFEKYVLIKVQRYSPRNTYFSTFAVDKKGGIKQFSYDPRDFLDFVLLQDIRIETLLEATAYAHLIRDIYLSPSLSYRIVEKLADVHFAENLDGESDATKRAFESKYRHVLQPTIAVQDGQAFVVSYYQIAQGRLEQVRIHIRRNGSFDKQIEVLERGLPVPFR